MKTPLEHILTNAYKDGMISFLNDHPECFEEAIELSITNKQPYSWRAAWLLWSCMEENDSRVQGHLSSILVSIPTKKDRYLESLSPGIRHSISRMIKEFTL